MALSEDAKRQAVSAVAAVRDDIQRVIKTGSTGYDIFGQPRFHPDEAPNIPSVGRWRETRDREEPIQEIRGKQRDAKAPGE